MWAAGIITYQLVFNEHPMQDVITSRYRLEERLKNFTEVNFPKKPEASLQVKHLIQSLL